MSVSCAMGTPFDGGQWQGGLAPAGSDCQSVNPAICPPPQSFDGDYGAFKTNQKGIIMAIIRKGYTRPIIAHPLRTFPSLIQAAAYIDRLTLNDTQPYRFNVVQDTANRWTVSRVISGGAA